MEKDKWSGSNPWLGLAPYSEETTLYGRSQESIQLSDIIKNNIASVVYGKSGIGKSSLLSAGISPILREENYIPIKIRLIHNSDVSYVEQIERRVLEAVNCNDLLSADIPDLGLWDFFHRHEFFTKDGTEDCIPVIIIDQFEEIYTLTDADHKEDIPVFFKELSALLNDIKPDNVIEEERRMLLSQDVVAPSPNRKRRIIKRSSATAINYISATTFRCVICLREDKLYLLERNSADIPSLKANRYNLHALSKDNALEVIMCPRPELFSNEEAIDIVDKLGDISDEGFRTVDPAILSLFLYKYYEKRGEANYDNIFADYYQESTNSIGRDSIAFLENHLLTLGGYRNQIPLEDALRSGVTRGEIDELLRSVILRTEKRKGIDYIEFSHDRLCTEAKKNREERATREQARKARNRNLLSLLVFIVSVGILSFVLWQMYQLNIEKQGRLSAEQATDSINKLNIANELQLHLNELQRDSIKGLNDSLFLSLQVRDKQLSVIKEQQRKIDELRSKTSIDEIVVKDNVAGNLSARDELPFNALMNVSSLTISGDLNATDIEYLKNAFKGNKLKHLDLGDVNIVEEGVEPGTNTDKTEIGNFRFFGSIETVILPKTITAIGKSMFSGCENLTSVILPDGIMYIGQYAFANCSGLTSLTIPNSVTSIGSNAFLYCRGLTSITIPNSVTTIGEYAFSYCTGLTSITIPNSVTTIGEYAFSYCTGLTSLTIPNSVTSIGNNAFWHCLGLTSLSIPNNVISIGHGAFAFCFGLTSLTIPNSVTSIGNNAFWHCTGLTSLTIPNSVTSIGTSAFADCTELKSVTIPNSVISMDGSAFWGCSGLIAIKVEEGNTMYDSRDNCNSIIVSSTNELIEGSNISFIPSSVTSIGRDAFSYCSGLTSITIPSSVTSIGEYAFAKCSGLIAIKVEEGNTMYDSRDNCNSIIVSSMNELIVGSNNSYIPNGVTSIGSNAFADRTGLTSITIPNSVMSIGEEAFANCSGLTSLTIPISAEIRFNAFADCTSLTRIYSQIRKENLVKVDETGFENIPENCTWYVPVGMAEYYKAQSWWVPTWNIIEEEFPIKDM